MASIEATAGEVWSVDFGILAKHRPVLILAFPQPEDARALVVVAPLISKAACFWILGEEHRRPSCELRRAV